jgi:ParB family chromosome partitioning protein
MKSKSLSQGYIKEKEQLGLSVQKTYYVKLETASIYVEKGFNLRDINQDHVNSIAATYSAGKYVPAIVVKPTPEGLKVIDGHHRLIAAQQSKIESIEVKSFIGDDADEVSFMITSSQGRNLNPIERAKGYQRLIGQGLTQKDIVARTGRSASDVKNHLVLMTASKKVQKAVADGTAGFGAVVEELNRTGFEGEKKIEDKIDSGEKVTRTSLKSWKPKDATTVMEIICQFEARLKDADLPEEFWELLKLYRG